MLSKKTILIVALAAIAIAVSLSLKDAVSLDVVKQYQSDIVSFIQLHPVLASAVFLIAYIVIVVLALPFASLFTVASGFFFPYWLALGLVLIGATAGATILFLAVRFGLGQAFYQKALPSIREIAEKTSEKPVLTLLFIRFLPIFPFFLVNLAVGLLKISTFVAIWTCFVGIIPGTALYVWLGQYLGEVESVSDLLDWRFFALMCGLAGFTLLVKWVKEKREKGNV